MCGQELRVRLTPAVPNPLYRIFKHLREATSKQNGLIVFSMPCRTEHTITGHTVRSSCTIVRYRIGPAPIIEPPEKPPDHEAPASFASAASAAS